MTSPHSICILMPTCHRYRPVAKWTIKRLDSCWPGHPEIILCGIRDLPGYRCLPFISDERDWTGIALEAAALLLQDGYQWLYLILDDHAPFGLCNNAYLNQLLPGVAGSVNAGCVSLCPWDGLQRSRGDILPDHQLGLCLLPETDKWRYSLHPGLWRIEFFHSLLDQVSKMPGGTTARGFEAVAGRESGRQYPVHNQAYRVAGRSYALSRGPLDTGSQRLLFHARRWFIRRFSSGALAAFDARNQYITRFMNGPYPIFWSGLMHHGIHLEALRYLAFCGDQRESGGAHKAALEVLAC